MDAIDATPGGTSANSYCTVLEADTYNDNFSSGSAWAVAASDQKIRALLTATRLIDEHYDFDGMATTWTQALQWPRSGMLDVKGAPIPYTEIPQKLKDATAEYARQLLAGDRTADSDVLTQGVSSFEAEGAIKVTFRDVIPSSVIPSAVTQMLSRWGAKRTARNSRWVMRS
jgi:hypothetical protein